MRNIQEEIAKEFLKLSRMENERLEIEKAIKNKFPNIKNLEVRYVIAEDCENDFVQLYFDTDSVSVFDVKEFYIQTFKQ